jgi:transcriptional regulator with XRE-family HTH domain
MLHQPWRRTQALFIPGTASTTLAGPVGGRLVGVERSEGVGSYVRAWRARLQPADVGLPAAGRRRTRGLRREELASLAGISVDYLIRLEQGRAVNPSPPVLAALARALRLDRDERDHLYIVAGQTPPKRTHISSHVTPGIQRLVDRLGDVPVAVYDAAWTIILWNPTWAALMGDPSALSGRDRNLLWRTFTGAASRVAKTPQEVSAFEESAVADLRRATGNYPDDLRLQQLVAELRQASPRFDELWQRRIVTQPDTGAKTLLHPEVGPVTLDCDVLTAAGTDLKIVVYTADPSGPDSEKLDLIRTFGLQRLSAVGSARIRPET